MILPYFLDSDDSRHVRRRPSSGGLKPIVLIGMHGSGKTTVGRILAQKLQRALYETDFMLSKRYFSNIQELMIKLGVTFFRRSEAWVLRHAMSNYENPVVTAGEGAVDRPDNVQFMRENGITFLLRTPIDVLLARTGQNPLFLPRFGKVQNKRNEVEQIWKEREPLYKAAAHYIVDTGSLRPTEIADEIIDLLAKKHPEELPKR